MFYESDKDFKKPAGNPPYFNGEMKGGVATNGKDIYGTPVFISRQSV